MTSRLALALLASVLPLSSQNQMPGPVYTADGALLPPQSYREWMFVGSNLDMGYSEAKAPKRSAFHNIYIQREAYREYAATGRFPDRTILVMEQVSAGTNASINKRGKFEDEFLGIEVALKDESRFPEKWAYFNFIGEGGKALPAARAQPKERCWACHNEHGAADNVFVQFYPVLRAARPR